MTSAAGEDRPPLRVVLADANVLYSRVLRDVLLYSAAEGIVEIRWSAEILAEVVEHLQRNLVTFDAASAARLVAAMNAAFPLAEVAADSDAVAAVAELRLPDDDDRHVVAAAVAVSANVLCTDNVGDFPGNIMDELGIQVMSADALLCALMAEFPQESIAAHRLTVSRLPGATEQSTLAALRRAGASRAAELLRSLLRV